MDSEIYFKDAKEMRTWLQRNHSKVKVLWIIYYKKHTKHPSVSYNEAVEQALCFGWIDSVIKRIDDERYMQKFTPRNPKSSWSDTNIERAKKMLELGFMHDAGKKLLPKDLDERKPLTKTFSDKLPDFIEKMMVANPRAYGNFYKLPPSHRRNFINWICSAKRPETQIKRLTETINLLNKGEKLGLK